MLNPPHLFIQSPVSQPNHSFISFPEINRKKIAVVSGIGLALTGAAYLYFSTASCTLNDLNLSRSFYSLSPNCQTTLTNEIEQPICETVKHFLRQGMYMSDPRETWVIFKCSHQAHSSQCCIDIINDLAQTLLWSTARRQNQGRLLLEECKPYANKFCSIVRENFYKWVYPSVDNC